MKVLIYGNSAAAAACAARLRRLSESNLVVMFYEAGRCAAKEDLTHVYNIDVRLFTRLVDNGGPRGPAVLEDMLTGRVYLEDYDFFVEAGSDVVYVPKIPHDIDRDAAAHITHHLAKFGAEVQYAEPPDPTDAVSRPVETGKVHKIPQIDAPRLGLARGRHTADLLCGKILPKVIPHDLLFIEFYDRQLARFGLSEKALNEAQVNYAYSIVPVNGGFLKLIFDFNGAVLGFLAFGNYVEKYVNTIASLVQTGSGVGGLAALEPAGCDALINLAKIAQNVIEQRLALAYWDEVARANPLETALLDVRQSADYGLNSLPGSVSIPLRQLRQNLYRLDKSKEIITISNTGKSAYIACLILTNAGFQARLLTGGVKYYELCASSCSHGI